jgi:hypothetical protein
VSSFVVGQHGSALLSDHESSSAFGSSIRECEAEQFVAEQELASRAPAAQPLSEAETRALVKPNAPSAHALTSDLRATSEPRRRDARIPHHVPPRRELDRDRSLYERLCRRACSEGCVLRGVLRRRAS